MPAAAVRAAVWRQGAFGNEAYILTGYFNLPKILELTLFNGYDHVAGRQLGLPLGKAEDFHSYEELLEAYHRQIDYFLDIKVQGSNLIESIYASYMPAPFLSVITNDCIRKGKDYNAGGARYNTSYIQGVGIGTVTDSLGGNPPAGISGKERYNGRTASGPAGGF